MLSLCFKKPLNNFMIMLNYGDDESVPDKSGPDLHDYFYHYFNNWPVF